MNIVAVSAEPEFLRLEATEGGGIDLTIEIARMQCTDTAELTRGSVQLHLLPADVDTMTEQLATIVSGLGFSVDRVKQQHSVGVRPAPGTFPDVDDQQEPEYEYELVFRNDRMGYVKTKRVRARGVAGAIEAGRELLKADGYDTRELKVIGLTRDHLPADEA